MGRKDNEGKATASGFWSSPSSLWKGASEIICLTIKTPAIYPLSSRELPWNCHQSLVLSAAMLSSSRLWNKLPLYGKLRTFGE